MLKPFFYLKHQEESWKGYYQLFRNNISPDPGYDDKHAGWKIVGDDVVGHFPLQNQLEASDRVISWEGVISAYRPPYIL